MSYYRGSPMGGGMGFAFPPATPMVRRILWTLVGAFGVSALLNKAGWTFLPNLLTLYPPGIPGEQIEVIPGIWQLLTYGLLHGGVWHLLMNMLGIWMFGGQVEQRLGSRAFLRYFLVCVAGGGLLHVVFTLTQGAALRAPVIGASAGVLGIVLAFAYFFPHRPVFLFPLPVPIKAWVMAVVFAGIDLFAAMDANSSSGVANFAHLGGMAAGFLYLKLPAGGGGRGGRSDGLDWRTRWFRWRMRRKRPFHVIQGDRREH